ncbi:MAG: winged helix-turn-helix transcriptional regulator [Candidatus Omnitrophica bacterium]|nr:winged helix-turn-helix transcriptional regulator [Candidatus Omnitrophota bacterium]
MEDKLTQAQNVFMNKINQICSKFGLNNIMAQLYALLYLNGRVMSLDEMAEALKISKGSVSVNIRALERYGAVKRVWMRGSRKDYYEAESDIYKVIMERVRSLVQGRLSEVEDMIGSADSVFESAGPDGNNGDEESAKIFKQRLVELKGIKEKAQNLFDLFNSGLLSNALASQRGSNKDTEEESLVIQT